MTRRTHRHVARFTIQTRTPLSVGSGRSGTFADNDVVRDANDLPAIPGTSLAGALRAAYASTHGREDAERLFGRGGAHDDARRSSVRVSWASIHNQENRPVPPRLAPGAVDADPVLRFARGLVVRDHVRIQHRGVADGRGKFDRSSVPAGARFTFEVELEGDASSVNDLERIAGLVASPTLRLGGRSRAGLGSFTPVDRQWRMRSFDLRSRKELDDYVAHPRHVSSPGALRVMDLPQPRGERHVEVSLKLRPLEPYQFAGGTDDAEKAPDILPVRETRIRWQGGQGFLGEPEFLAPGTSLKGALKHRAAFHLRVRSGKWAHTQTDAQRETRADIDVWSPERLEGLEALMGRVHEASESDHSELEDGTPGLVYIDDVWLGARKTAEFAHVSLDRFTGGPMPGALFTDRAVIDGHLAIRILIRLPEDQHVPAQARAAFRDAVRDLAEGRLQVGAGAGRGYGWFEAASPWEWKGPGLELWMKEDEL